VLRAVFRSYLSGLLVLIVAGPARAEAQLPHAQCRLQTQYLVCEGNVDRSSAGFVAHSTREVWAEIQIAQIGSGTPGGNSERAFRARILSVTGQQTPAIAEGLVGPASREEDLLRFLAESDPAGHAGTYLWVDSRGRIRTKKGEDEDRFDRFARAFIDEVVADLLFPGLPPEDEPFEVGSEWDVTHRNAWRGIPALVQCDSVKLWTDGRAEVQLSVDRREENSVETWHWTLTGCPVSVQEARKEYWTPPPEKASVDALVVRLTVEIRILSGPIPVRP
jgi:hypothetical protein